MQRRRILRAPATAVLLGGLLLLLLGAALPRQVLAADAPAVAPAGAPTLLPGRSYVVMPGDTLDKVVSKAMTGSPLKNEVLREALVAANAPVLPAGKNPRLVPGTVLYLPDPQAVLLQLAAPLVAAAEPPVAPASTETRKRWVRFP